MDCKDAHPLFVFVFFFADNPQAGNTAVGHGSTDGTYVTAFFWPGQNNYNVVQIHAMTIALCTLLYYNQS